MTADSKDERRSIQWQDNVERQFAEEFFAAGSWMQFRLDLLNFLKIDEAVLFSFLVNRSQRCRARSRRKGWFYCKATYIEKKLHFSTNTQTRLFTRLREAGILLTEWRGQPAKRWIKLDCSKALELSLRDKSGA